MQYSALLSSAIIAAAAKDKRHQCPCGAVADPLTGLCRKCQARKAWRRKTTTTRRKTTRRRLVRRVRNVAWFLADVLTLLPALANGMEP